MTRKRYLGILADLDGTINRGETLIRGAREIYDELRNRGIRWMFLSNNATRSASLLAQRINSFGLRVSEDQVLNSASALIRSLTRERPQARVYVVGERPLIEAIKAAGITVVDDSRDVDIVVAAMDREFGYAKLANAQAAICGGATFWATNLDPSVPVENGIRPGAGAIIAAIGTAADHPPDRVFGKPSPDLAYIALEQMGLPADQCLVVGDRMTTDVLLARNAGIDSALVLTGAISREDLPRFSYAPDYIFNSIADIRVLFE
jgi:HAD superfamily hydrolase (TIGR01457 family)